MPPTGVHALFPDAPPRAGMYESFYLRAVAPDRPLGVWIRCTAHKRPGQPRAGVGVVHRVRRPRRAAVHAQAHDRRSSPSPPAAGSRWATRGSGPRSAEGACGEARWSLRFASEEPELRHLPHALLYRAPLPRTKLTSPAPAARFEGTLELPGRTLALDGWRGMVGHNWGAQHAERWIWLHGIGFDRAARGVDRRGDRARARGGAHHPVGRQRGAAHRRGAPPAGRCGRAGAAGRRAPRALRARAAGRRRAGGRSARAGAPRGARRLALRRPRRRPSGRPRTM